MIVTVTLNPSLDRTLSVPQINPGTLHRARYIKQDLGGKGLNVSRALRALEIPSRIVGFVAGGTGKALHEGLAEAGFDVHIVEVEGESRQNLTLLDESSGQYTKINESGPTINEQHIAIMEDLIRALVRPGDLWAFCGTLPSGAPFDLYARLISLVQNAKCSAFLDASGAAFRAALAARPFAVKPNSEEAAELLQAPLRSDEEHGWAARRLQAEGARLVALTRGAQGLVLALDDELVIATPPPVVARSPIGAGDAALAGLLWSVSDQCDTSETARRAVACGTAAAMQEATGIGDRGLIESLLPQIRVKPMKQGIEFAV